MRSSIATYLRHGRTSERLGSVLPLQRRLLTSSHAKLAVPQLSDIQRKDVVIMALRTARRWVSSSPPPAAPLSPPAPAGNLSTGSENNSGPMPATSHSGAHRVDAHLVTQFAAPVKSRASRVQRCISHRRRRQFHGATTCGESSTKRIEAATSVNASGADVPLTANGDACMRPAPSCSSPPLHTGASEPHFAMSPVQQRMCQLIGTGAWREALEVLCFHEQEDTAARQHVQASWEASSASGLCRRRSSALTASEDTDGGVEAPLIFVSLQEASVWLLLWCGYSTAAWQAWWRTMHPVTSPRLVLLLALFTHVVERDAMRTRDLLLLFEMESGRATTPASAISNGQMCEENPTSPMRVWWRLLWQWLWCCNECTASSKSPSQVHRRRLASFLEGAVEQLTKCVFASSVTPTGHHMGTMAETVALLLLVLRDMHCTCDEWQRMWTEVLTAVCEGKPMQSSRNSLRSAPTPLSRRNAVRSLLLSTSTCALMGKTVKSALCDASSTPNNVGRDNGERAEELSHVHLRKIFSDAEHDLKRLRSHCSPAVPADSRNALEAFRVWHERIVESEGLGSTWAALRLALHPPPTEPRAFSLDQPTAPDRAARVSLQRLLRRIDNATSRGDWITALQLCLSHGVRDGLPYNKDTESLGVETQDLISEAKGPSRCRLFTPTPTPVDAFPFVHRLSKGLVACEVARPFGASWQGALALWNFARQYSYHQVEHASPPDIAVTAGATSEPLRIGPHPPGSARTSLSLRHALGRIFFLLASASRWAEALACFHETPDVYLDGFVVSQVAYALRRCPSQNRAVLDLWAMWRCRVGDAVDPTESMTHKLLLAMLQASATATSPVATLSSTSFQSPAMVAEKVATAVLVAAADRSPSTPAMPVPDGQCAVAIPGTAVPLNWSRQRHVIRSIINDRWVGSWADALSVALASGDVSLLLHTVLRRVPPVHVPKLYSSVRRALQVKGVVLSSAERAALLALCGEGRKLRLIGNPDVSAGEATFPSGEAVPSIGESGGAHQHVLNTEAFLDELLGVD
ncbi:conserved hypothetical protein [Leishmania braziliensis MHOM/BR/75/M2904]|uniref:Uncharacterized protein n=2 Tax=Leishmania braziliensis TaxID=5660 RepID=A4H7Q4_LEIBR|nr:conserved hypothetical protein [Leishmania braziliensis MHOM/BR/75/M2904]CAJ2468988.1 unnamed protein product [Leishmania braziliensis]CAM37569.1 conserved hypothetical protein [Leishmania braziliensis MHOM/BR/75/M2904]SYZ64079.1 hypothetical_protein [Leishmania braziliensis MHOM/BR/75/M2904]